MKNIKWWALIAVIIAVPLNGCYDYLDIEEIGYIISISVDEKDDATFCYTFQYAKPSIISSNSGGTESNSPVCNVSVNASNLNSAVDILDNYAGKKTTLSHVKVILLSVEINRTGMLNLAKQFSAALELRPGTSVIMVPGKVEMFLESANSSIQNDPTKYYEFIDKFGVNGDLLVTLSEFNDAVLSQSQSIIMPIVSFDKLHSKTDENPAQAKKLALEEELNEKTAVILNSGEVAEQMTRSQLGLYKLLTSKAANVKVNLDEFGDVIVNCKNHPRYSIDILGDKIAIKIKINLRFKNFFDNCCNDINFINTLQCNEKNIEKILQQKLTDFANEWRYKHEADIFAISKRSKRYFWTWNDWQSQDWSTMCRKMIFYIEIT